MRREDWIVAGVLGSVHFAFHFFMRIVPPLIPVLAVELSIPLWQLGLLVSMYFIGAAVGLVPAGIVSDLYDRRITLPIGIVLVSCGYLLFSVAGPIGSALPTLAWSTGAMSGRGIVMNAGMFVAGVGTAVHVPVGVPILTANISEGNTGKVMGIWTGMSSLGDAASPAVIGILILFLAWVDIVLVFAGLGLVYALWLFLVLRSDAFETRPLAIQDSADDGGPVHLPSDRRAYLYPMLVILIYFAGYMVAVQGAVTFIPLFVSEVYAYRFTVGSITVGPESFADFALSVVLVAAAAARFLGGIAVDRFDHRPVLIGSLAVAGFGLALLTLVPLGSLALLVVLAIFGASLWGNTPARNTLVSDLAPGDREGRTFSYLWAGARVFGAISPVFIGYIAETAGIRHGFGYLTVAVFVSALSIALLYSDRVYRPVDATARRSI